MKNERNWTVGGVYVLATPLRSANENRFKITKYTNVMLLYRMLEEMYEDQGDTLALQYGGSQTRA